MFTQACELDVKLRRVYFHDLLIGYHNLSPPAPVPSQMVGESEVYNNPSFIFLQLYHTTTSLREGASGRLPLLLPGGEVGGEEGGEERRGGGEEGGEKRTAGAGGTGYC